MFKQIVSSLSMTPQAASQLTFYARRLKQESITRSFSAIAATLLIALQVLTVVAPASASNSANANDLIPGGYTSKADLLAIYDKNPTLRLIYSRFGVTRNDIASPYTRETTINSRDYGNTLKSVGHNPTSCAGETAIPINNNPADTVYLRHLSCFDTGSNRFSGSSYKALVGRRAIDGGYFSILEVCGNIVIQTMPPQPNYACTSLHGTPLSGTVPLIVAFTARAEVSGGEKIVGYHYNFGDGTQQTISTTATSNFYRHDYLKPGSYRATVSVENASTHQLKSSPACSVSVTVGAKVVVAKTPVKSITPTPTLTPTPAPKTVSPTPTPNTVAPTPVPVVAAAATINCMSLAAAPASGTAPLQVTFTAAASATNQTVTDYSFNFGDNSSADSKTPIVSHNYTQAGSYLATLTVKGSTGASASGPSCQFQINVGQVPAAFLQTKSAYNQTQKVDATTKLANPGDIIVYTLATKNTGGASGQAATVDNLSDILEYADVTTLGGATINTNIISWPAETIAGGSTITHTFAVTITSDPAVLCRPQGVSNTRSYDLKMENVFGNAVVVAIAPPTCKQIETASQTMPQTGPGTSIMIILVIAGMIFFFYLRNRQLVAEIKLLRTEYQGDASHVS